MKVTYKILLAVLIISIGCSSCDNFLSIRPKDALYPKTLTDYENLLNYPELMKTGATFPSFMTDDIYILDEPEPYAAAPYLLSIEAHKRTLYTFGHGDVFSDAEPDYFWTSTYKNIDYYNTVIDYAPDATDATDEERTRVIAEAKAARALEYLCLVNCYAPQYDPKTATADQSGVPLILHPDIMHDDLKRATLQECYDQILTDLTDALPHLPEVAKPSKYRMSRGACAGILARAYLILGDYDKCLSYANEALKSNNALLDLKTISVLDPYGYIGRSSMPLALDDPEAILIRLAPYAYGNCEDQVSASPELVSLFDEKHDRRTAIFYIDNYYGMPFEPSTLRLYSAWYQENIGISSSEMYLTAAECEARIGSVDRAMELLNKLRTNRIEGYEPMTAAGMDREKVLDEVLLERRREFALRGMFRFIDLRRFAKDPKRAVTVTHNTGDGQTESITADDPRFTLPIPQVVMRINPNMKQNKR